LTSLDLSYAGWSLSLRPELGGSISTLRHQNRDVLRATPAGATDPLETACFPLVPYANRIANGRFTFAGQNYDLPRNAPGQDHPLHGVGWNCAWSTGGQDDRSVTLLHSHVADVTWLWNYAAEQRFELSEKGLHITLSVENRDTRSMPAGLGFHPYFPATPKTLLQFEAHSVWLADAAMLPTQSAAVDHFADWSVGETVQRTSLIDNAYAGWIGVARIEGPFGALELTGEGTPFLHVFMPPNADFFCAEPVSDMPDALNRAASLAVLAPGQSRRITMALTLA
jgi:aldose 1-epimerase